jgi:gliding motility-associated-like protein
VRVLFFIHLFFLLLNLQAQTPLYAELYKSEARCGNGNAWVKVTGGLGTYTVTWSNGTNGLLLSDAAPGDYTVHVKDDVNDTLISFSILDEECEVNISNHFTPNDDNYNDRWQLVNIDFYPDFDLFVYNRWGQLVHRQTQKYIPWDGTNLGVPLPDGPYYFVFYFDKNDKNRILKGDVNILR